jgi:hypothetical protein
VNFPVTAGDTVGLRGARRVAGSVKETPMAQWVRRPRTDGGESIQIKWRIDGRWQSETFTDARLAVEFRTAVELAGHRWPEGWVRGEGWATVVPAPGRGVAVLPEPEPEPVVTLAEVANGPEGYFAHQRKRVLRGKVKPYTVHRAERAFALHLEPAFGACAFVGLGPFGDEGARADVSAVLDAGVEAALSYLERYGVAGTVGEDGTGRVSGWRWRPIGTRSRARRKRTSTCTTSSPTRSPSHCWTTTAGRYWTSREWHVSSGAHSTVRSCSAT